MTENARGTGPGLPVDLDNLEFLPEGDTGGLDLDTLPPIGTPIVASHTITVPMEIEQVLRAEADRRGISVEDLILARLQNAA